LFLNWLIVFAPFIINKYKNTKFEILNVNFSNLRLHNVVVKVEVTYPLSLSIGEINTEIITSCWQLHGLRMQIKNTEINYIMLATSWVKNATTKVLIL
jgi:hypothetical protein